MSSNGFKLPLLWLVAFVYFSACGASSFTSKITDPETKERNQRQEITDFASNFLGTKYKYAGKLPSTGFDCSGFTSYIMSNFEIELSPSSQTQAKQGKKIDVKDAKPGDLIFFNRSRGGRIFHVAMVYSNDEDGIKIIHSTNRGVVIDQLMANKYWRPKIAFARDVVAVVP